MTTAWSAAASACVSLSSQHPSRGRGTAPSPSGFLPLPWHGTPRHACYGLPPFPLVLFVAPGPLSVLLLRHADAALALYIHGGARRGLAQLHWPLGGLSQLTHLWQLRRSSGLCLSRAPCFWTLQLQEKEDDDDDRRTRTGRERERGSLASRSRDPKGSESPTCTPIVCDLYLLWSKIHQLLKLAGGVNFPVLKTLE